MKRPICPYCKRQCSRSGGAISADEKERESYWTCWDCKYHIVDAYAEEVKPKQLEIVTPHNIPS